MHKRFCLCSFPGVSGIWGGNWGTGKGVCCVQMLTRDMADGIVKAHEADPEAEDMRWQTIKVGFAKEGYQGLVVYLQQYCLADDIIRELLTWPHKGKGFLLNL